MAFGFRNPFEGFGQAISNAGAAVAGFFQQRAQNQLTQGVAAIQDAKDNIKRIDAAMANPDANLSAEEQLALNLQRSYYNKIVTATPNEALKLSQAGVPGGVKTSQLTRAVPKMAARTSQAQGGFGAVQPTGETTTQTSTQYGAIPYGQFVSGLEQRANIGARKYQEGQVASERNFLLLRDNLGNQQQLRVQSLQHAHELLMQGKNQEYQKELDKLQADLNLKGDVYRTQLDAYLRSQQATTDFERQKELTLTAEQRNAYNAELANVQDDINNNRDPEATAGHLQDILADPNAPSYVKSKAQRLLDNLPEQANALYQKSLEQRAAESDAAIAQAEATKATAGPLAQAQLARAYSENRILRFQETQSKQQIAINGQTIKMNELATTGQELQNNHQAWANNREKILAGQQDLTGAKDYVRGAISAADPASIQQIIDEKNNPGSHPEVSWIAQTATEQELQDALSAASDQKNNRDLNYEYAQAQMQTAIDQAQFSSVEDKANFIKTVSSVYTPEQLAGLASTDPKFKQLVESGLISADDLNAALTQSSYRVAIDNENANAPKITRINDQLQMLTGPPQDPATAEASLRSYLEQLVSLNAMQEDQVDGIVSAYQYAWQHGADKDAADLAYTKALRESALAQGAYTRAQTSILTSPF